VIPVGDFDELIPGLGARYAVFAIRGENRRREVRPLGANHAHVESHIVANNAGLTEDPFDGRPSIAPSPNPAGGLDAH
jgi:hypothetical protein